jgi:tetratricopeptide (TPR) repeat protein
MTPTRFVPRAAIVVTLALAGSTFDCSGYAADHIARGDAEFDARNFRDAVVEYTKAVRVSPDDPHTIHQLGLSHKALGNRSEAYTFLEKARTLDPADTTARATLASMYLEDHRAELAINEALALVQTAPRNLEGLNLLGSAYLAQRNPMKALETFRKIVDVAPTDGRGPYLVGLALLGQGRPTEARQSFEKALSTSPSLVDPLSQLVQLDLAEKRSDAAVARIERQIAKTTVPAPLYELLGSVRATRGERDLAEAAFRKAADMAPGNAEAHLRLIELYMESKQYTRAIEASDSALRIDPKNALLLFTRGVAFEQMNDTARAKDAYARALHESPRFAAAANNLAVLLSNTGDQEQALRFAEMAKAAAPDDPRITDTLGWILYKRGDYTHSAAALNDAAAKLPAEPTVAYHVGMAKAKVGDIAGARTALSRAAKSSIDFPDKRAAAKALLDLK